MPKTAETAEARRKRLAYKAAGEGRARYDDGGVGYYVPRQSSTPEKTQRNRATVGDGWGAGVVRRDNKVR